MHERDIKCLKRLNTTVDGNNVQSLNAGQYMYVTYCHCKSLVASVQARDGQQSRQLEDGDESNTFF